MVSQATATVNTQIRINWPDGNTTPFNLQGVCSGIFSGGTAEMTLMIATPVPLTPPPVGYKILVIRNDAPVTVPANVILVLGTSGPPHPADITISIPSSGFIKLYNSIIPAGAVLKTNVDNTPITLFVAY